MFAGHDDDTGMDDMRSWGRVLAVLVAAATVTGGTTTATAEETDRLTAGDAAHADAGEASAEAIVALPDLGITHRLPAGGMNLWRMPLSDLEADFAEPSLVKKLDFGGFSYGNSKTLAGDVATITPSDDGTADHIIWHAQPNGGVLLWAVGGGGDTTPQLWQDLRTGGWSYANSVPMVGDVTGDGWDDLVVSHANGAGANIWVFPSDGTDLGGPELWLTLPGGWGPNERYFLADVDGDGLADFMRAIYGNSYSGQKSLIYEAALSSGTGFDKAGGARMFTGPASAGWSLAASRQLAGDVTGDGLTDLVTIHAQPNGGILAWVHRNCDTGTSLCLDPPQIWQDLRTGGWSFAGSRQHLADTDGDGRDDLVSVHSQSGNPGILVWRHVSTGTGLSTPQVIADLRTGGWTYSASREGVADTYGTY